MAASGDPIMSRSAGIFVLYRYVGVSHSIISTAEFLESRGWHVDIFTKQQSVGENVLPKHLNLIQHHEVPKWCIFPLNLIAFAFASLWNGRKKKYRIFFGVDPEGLIIAWLVGKLIGVPICYYSLELLLSEDIPKSWHRAKWMPSKERMLKWLERKIHRKALLTIIQDKRRAKLLFEDNRMSPGATYFVPHTGREGVFREDVDKDYLRKRFGIGHEKKIILMVGGINATTLALEVAEISSMWEASWHLVLHGFGPESYINMMKEKINSKRVTISTELLEIGEFAKLVSSADIGLALYPNSCRNIYEMTSGKIGQYFRCGIPVVANDFPNLINVVKMSGAGVCISNLGDLHAGLETILRCYDSFKKAAYQAYLDFYDFDSSFEPVYEHLKRL